MENKLGKLKAVVQQSKWWRLYGYITPIGFTIVGTSLYLITHTEVQSIFIASWVLLMASSIIWWFWTLKVMAEMANTFNRVFEIVTDLRDRVSDVKDDIGKLRQ